MKTLLGTLKELNQQYLDGNTSIGDNILALVDRSTLAEEEKKEALDIVTTEHHMTNVAIIFGALIFAVTSFALPPIGLFGLMISGAIGGATGLAMYYATRKYLVSMKRSQSDFKTYRKLKKRQLEDAENKFVEALIGEVGNSKPFKEQAEWSGSESCEKSVYEGIASLSRSIYIADGALKRLIENKPLLSSEEYKEINTIASHLENAAKEALLIAPFRRYEEGAWCLPSDLPDYHGVYVLKSIFDGKKMSTTILRAPEPHKMEGSLFAYQSLIAPAIPGLKAIASERVRQITKHGYDEQHDLEHTDGSIADAAAYYLSQHSPIIKTEDGAEKTLWPWDNTPPAQSTNTNERYRRVVKGAAMALAESVRLASLVDVETQDKKAHVNVIKLKYVETDSPALPLDYSSIEYNTKEIHEIFGIPEDYAKANALLMLCISSATRRDNCVTLTWSILDPGEIISFMEAEIDGYLEDKDKMREILSIIKSEPEIAAVYFEGILNDMLEWEKGN